MLKNSLPYLAKFSQERTVEKHARLLMRKIEAAYQRPPLRDRIEHRVGEITLNRNNLIRTRKEIERMELFLKGCVDHLRSGPNGAVRPYLLPDH